jgi:hypothetical protein
MRSPVHATLGVSRQGQMTDGSAFTLVGVQQLLILMPSPFPLCENVLKSYKNLICAPFSFPLLYLRSVLLSLPRHYLFNSIQSLHSFSAAGQSFTKNTHHHASSLRYSGFAPGPFGCSSARCQSHHRGCFSGKEICRELDLVILKSLVQCLLTIV